MKKRRSARSRTLQCELLESREMMAASATLTSGGVLNVVGSDGDETIKFFQSGKNIYIQGLAGYWSASKVKSIYVDSKGGDDFVSLDSYGNGGNKAIKEVTTIIGGAGSERVSVGAAHDLYFSGQGTYAQVDAKGVARAQCAEVNLASYTKAVLKSGAAHRDWHGWQRQSQVCSSQRKYLHHRRRRLVQSLEGLVDRRALCRMATTRYRSIASPTAAIRPCWNTFRCIRWRVTTPSGSPTDTMWR